MKRFLEYMQARENEKKNVRQAQGLSIQYSEYLPHVQFYVCSHTKCTYKVYNSCQVLLNNNMELLFLLYHNTRNHTVYTFNISEAWNVYLLYCNMYYLVHFSSSGAHKNVR